MSERRVGEAAASKLPAPEGEALEHSERLTAVIRREIEAAGGRLPFDRYMELALYAPGLGYYTAGSRKFGEGGDFVTAPEISPLFAQCLARQCVPLLERLGGADILEFGAGSGALATDLLIALEQLGSLPEHYFILELSPDLRARQQETLASRAPELLPRVEWLDGLPESGFRGVVLANEVLDAMPVQRFRIADGEVSEQMVGWEDDHFVTQWAASASAELTGAIVPLAEHLAFDPDDYESEINLRAASWLQALGEVISAGAVLLIDYGYPQAEYYHPQRDRGTLMCYYRHQTHPDPLILPGLQDITAHVDFTAMAEAAQKAGFSVAGYTTQTYFLMGCGLDQLVAASDPSDVATHMALVQGVKRLTLPAEMGERFKVLGLTRDLDVPLAGFAMRDMRERL
ncbi:MAG: SAM-dependent methyltransferase [Candidatus Sedimenticola sp. (ex Thyasira tokunagai)]